MGKVIDFDGVRPSDQFEVIFNGAGQYEQAAEAAIATLQTDSDQNKQRQAIAILTFLGAKLDDLEASGVDIA
jgi:hypothetical protein